MSRLRCAFAILMFALPFSAYAQQPATQQAAPGILVVSAQKCSFTGLADMKRWMRESSAPILNELVRQGKLNSWGLLDHMWGDEWNLVIYYSARDLNTFQSAFGEYFGQVLRKDPQALQKFETACSEHKDNIYNIVMNNTTTTR
jgi:hypothetical protein